MIIKSSTSLRNEYGTISALAHKTAEPIYITKNGEGDIVVMSIDAFEKREEYVRLKERLDLAERARRSGEQTVSLEESKTRIDRLYER